MRADMPQVIVERPRYPDRGAGRKGRAVAFEDMPRQEGMRRPHLRYWGGKEISDNLAPLRRFLEARVGRQWDAVYAEITAGLRGRNTIQQHLIGHLGDFVAIRARRVNRWRPGGLWWQPLYVCPRTGVLKRTDVLERRRARSGVAAD